MYLKYTTLKCFCQRFIHRVVLIDIKIKFLIKPIYFMPQNSDLNFLYEIGSLKNLERGWRQNLAMDCASVLEHTMRVIWLALIIARREGGGADENLIIKMALVHDLPEARVSDLNYVPKMYIEADEARAGHDLFSGTIVEDYETNLKDFEERFSLEAKIVKDADNLDVDVELREMAERGSKLPEKWQKFRRFVRDEKLYTASAKKLWDEIQDSDPADWHLNNNKWLKIPNAGR